MACQSFLRGSCDAAVPREPQPIRERLGCARQQRQKYFVLV
jgi:hypothetical protein